MYEKRHSHTPTIFACAMYVLAKGPVRAKCNEQQNNRRNQYDYMLHFICDSSYLVRAKSADDSMYYY